MKRRWQILPGRRMKIPKPKVSYEQGQSSLRSTQSDNEDLLLGHTNFVAKPPNARREQVVHKCEVSALTTKI
ncbi:hypothetical protein ACFLUJ_03790 [Chloroflexota bacterium]